MARELIVQTEIKRSVIAGGGFAVKLANRFTIGIPDLALWLPPFAPFILEVKDFGQVTAKFDRQVDVTPKQRDTMRRMSVYPFRPVCGVAVHATMPNSEQRLYLLPFDAERCHWEDRNFVPRRTGGLYNLAELMRVAGVPVI